MLCSASALPRLFHFLMYLLYFLLLQLFFSFSLMTITFLFYNLKFIHLSSHVLKRCFTSPNCGRLSLIFVHFLSVSCDCPFSNSILPYVSFCFSSPPMADSPSFLLSSTFNPLLLASIPKFFCFLILPFQTLSPTP